MALPDPSWTLELVRRLSVESEPDVVEAWTAILVRQDAAAAILLLERWLRDPRTFPTSARRDLPGSGLPRDSFPGLPARASRGFPLGRPLALRTLAAVALEELEAASVVPELLTLLSDPDPDVRRAAAWSLEGLTNRPPPASGEDVSALARAYGRWFQQNGTQSREVWLREGFRLAGFPVGPLDAHAAPTLVRALKGPAPVAWNAHRALCRIAGAQPPGSICTFEETQAYWERWLKRHKVRGARLKTRAK